MSKQTRPDKKIPAPPARADEEELSDEELEDVAGGADEDSGWAPPPLPVPLPPIVP
jgi:hypothetical protein